MTSTDRKTVLISEPHVMETDTPWIPKMYGILKTYWERNGLGEEATEWLLPISGYIDHASTLLKPYEDKKIDVLGMSCYFWSWKVQCQVAKEVKARNPDCLVVVGGPEPDYKHPDFFKDHPYIDMVAVKDGEITFSKLLEKVVEHDNPRDLLAGKSEYFADVPGLYLPGNGNGHIFTGQAEIPMVFDYSPYIEQSDYYEYWRRSLPTREVAAIWETTRGCPYRCSFCDWGSYTMSRVRKFDIDRVREEIEWFAKMKIANVFLADANFGILPRDTEIAELAAETKAKYGYPTYIMYSAAKNNPDRSIEIAKTFFVSGLSQEHFLSLQHTRGEVLSAIDRENISPEKQIEVVRELRQHGVPIYPQLIKGCPGDTYDLWKKCFADLMEEGIHEYYWVFPWQQLPNSPSSEPDYIKEWEIDHIDRYLPIDGAFNPENLNPELKAKTRLIVGTKSFSRDDWVRMAMYSAFVKAFHNNDVTQSIAIYMRFTHDVSYLDFYGDLIENFVSNESPTAEWQETLRKHYQNFLEDEEAIDFVEIPQLPDFKWHFEPARWLYIQIGLTIEPLFDALRDYLPERYPEATNLNSLLNYHEGIVKQDLGVEDTGVARVSELNWSAYFEEAHKLQTFNHLPEPTTSPTKVKADVGPIAGAGKPISHPLSHAQRFAKKVVQEALGARAHLLVAVSGS